MRKSRRKRIPSRQTNDSNLSTLFGALADSTRRSMLERLSTREMNVGELAAPYEMSLPAISKHIRVLEKAGLLTQQVDGRIRICRFNPMSLKNCENWIETYSRFWSDQFESLEKYLSEIKTSKDKGSNEG